MFGSLIRGPDEYQNLCYETKYSMNKVCARRVYSSKIGRNDCTDVFLVFSSFHPGECMDTTSS